MFAKLNLVKNEEQKNYDYKKVKLFTCNKEIVARWYIGFTCAFYLPAIIL